MLNGLPFSILRTRIMGALEDYLNTLDGQDNLDVTEVASKMLELHNNEMGIASSKISTLETSIGEKDTLISSKDDEIKTWKSKNWDLVNQLPVNNPPAGPKDGDEKPDGATIGFDDILFKKDN